MKTIRTGVYAFLKYQDNIVVIKKGRGPFTGLLDLPGGKIEHGEKNIESLEREIIEEVGLQKGDFLIEKLLTVEEDFVQHIWQGEEKDEHIIAIIYEVKIIKEFDLGYEEVEGDAKGIRLISMNDNHLPMTPILTKILSKVNNK